MGLLSHKVKRRDIQKGDHLYTWRAGYTYSHHGIYVGRDKIVHFTQDQNNSSCLFSSSSSSVKSSSCSSSSSNLCSSSSSSSCSSSKTPTCLDSEGCGFRKDGSGVILSCLNCFLENGSLFRFEYDVGRLTFFVKARGGTCTRAKSDHRKDVVRRARHLLRNGFGDYDLFKNNCEDFALYCKTGLIVRSKEGVGGGSSGQASSFWKAAGAAGIAGGALACGVSTPLVAGVAVYYYSKNRHEADIGVRADVEKVDVKNMCCARGIFAIGH